MENKNINIYYIMSLIYKMKDSDINNLGRPIINCGNSCFFNATNQMLFHIPEFREFLILNQKLLITNSIIDNLIELFNKMKDNTLNTAIKEDTNLKEGNLSNFYSTVQNIFFNGNNYEQQDAPELIIKYLDKIFIDIFSNLYIPKTIPFLENNLAIDLNINLPIFNLLVKFITKRTCILNPNKIESLHIEYLHIKTSEIEDRTEFNINLNDRIEILDASNNITACKTINKNEKNTKLIESYEPNEYIIIHLKRFINTNPDPTGPPNIIKLDNLIENFNIKSNNDNFIILDKYNNKYNLIGGICHGGSTTGGHYWYKHKINNEWKIFNDGSPIIDSLPDSNELYVLLFKKYNEIPLYLNIKLNDDLLKTLNLTILQNTDMFMNTFDTDRYYRYDNQEKINFYIKLMTYYVSIYNKKRKINFYYSSEYDSYLINIRNKLIKKIKPLLI
jgi:ubiquitin carboxyl-terminal hydrolase 2/21